MITKDMDNEILTPQEVADLLKIDTQTVKRYIKENRIKAVYLSSHVIRILKKDIEYLFN